MRYLLNLLYLLILSVIGVCSILPRLRRKDVLSRFTHRLLGLTPQPDCSHPVVWFHAVSMGETLLCGPLMKRLQIERPDLRFVLSVFSHNAMHLATREYPDLPVFYAPYDFTWAVRLACRTINPVLYVIAENDIWPNIISELGRRNIPVAIFNTRMALREQREHRWNGWLIQPSLKYVRWWGTVTAADAEWIARLLGVNSPPVEVTGSLKFDGRLRNRLDDRVQSLSAAWGISRQDFVLVAGSTHAPEEELIIRIFIHLQNKWPDFKLILVPRNSERFDEVASILTAGRVNFLRASHIGTSPNRTHPDSAPHYSADHATESARIILGDTIGQLRDIWGLATVAFVGGSLCNHGGHNLTEPASYGVPVCFGPYVETIRAVADELLAADAAVEIQSPEAFDARLEHWLRHPEEAVQMGIRARQVVEQQTESLQTAVNRIVALLPEPAPCPTS